MPELSVIGASYRTAPVEVRERLALAPGQVSELLAAMHAEKIFDEALVLSTCNRTELYVVPRAPMDPLACFLDHVGRIRGAPPETPPGAFYRHDDTEAVRHVLRVAASLDSQIVGEHEILGQVKEAYRLAVEARTAGFLLNRLLHRAFRAGKRVRTETDLGRGSASVASAAVELATHVFSDLAGKTVLVVGAGRTAETAARALLGCGATNLIVANRTLDRARQLADAIARGPAEPVCGEDVSCPGADEGPPATCPALVAEAADQMRTEGGLPADAPQAAFHEVTAEAVGLDDLPAAVARADLVITSTSSAEPVLTHAALAPTLRRRRGALLLIDIAVPRDVDERLGELDNVYLYNIDDLDRLVARNLERRRQEIPKAEAIVEDEVAEFARWLASRGVAPTIRLLQKRLEGIQQAQIARYGRKFAEADREQLEVFTRALCSQILHKPLALLKGLSANGSTSERLATADLIRRLFDLDSLDEEAGRDGHTPRQP